MKNLKVAVLGCGSLGLLWGSRLTSFFDTTFITNTHKQAVLLNETGLRVYFKQQEFEFYSSQAICILELQATFDIVFIMTKQFHIPNLIDQILLMTHKNSLLFFWQNGIGNEIFFNDLKFSRPNLYKVITSEGASKINANSVQVNGSGDVQFGSVFSSKRAYINYYDSFFDFLRSHQINQVDNISFFIWQKLIFNCIINPLTAFYEVNNGKLLEDRFYGVILGLLLECLEIANKESFHFDRKDMLLKLNSICSKTFNNKSSMLQDILNGRETEINYLNGFIISCAKKYNIDVPYNKFIFNEIVRKSNISLLIN